VMKKPELRIHFTDTFDCAERFFSSLFARRYTVIKDPVNPKYLIYGCFGMDNDRYKGDVTRVFYTGENERPSYFGYNHAITFDHENSPKHYRMPLYLLDMASATYDNWTSDYYYLLNKKIADPEKEYDMKKGFCSFIQSNPRSNVRNEFFHMLSEYKRVDSAGPHLNNTGFILPRNDIKYKVDWIRNYKFNIAMENQSHPGYITEKILNCFYGNTVPIYWGSVTAHRDFNPEAFINCHSFSYFDNVLAYVMHLDSPEGKQEYLDMLTAPAFKDNKKTEWMNFDRFLDWWAEFVYRG
jgi:alpha(1,3/1,4) fucosyltransferase